MQIQNNWRSLFVAIAIATIPLIHPPSVKAASGKAASEGICPTELQQEVEKIAKSPRLQLARVGVFVQTNEANPQVLANLDGDRLFNPASNTKLLTTAIALKVLGADYRFVTSLMSSNLPNAQGLLENGLWVMGSGDPSFSSATGLKSLVSQLKDKGVKRINGGIWTKTSRRGEDIVGSWEWQDLQEYYAARVSPFTIDENSLNWKISPNQIGKPAIFEWENPTLASDWRIENQSITIAADAEYSLPENGLRVVRPYGQKVLIISGQILANAALDEGGVAVPDPEANFVRLLRQELKSQGIEVTESPDISNTSRNPSRNQPPTQNLAIFSSPNISTLITTTNKDSNNLYAELLLRALGEKFYAKLLQKPFGDRFSEVVNLNNETGGLNAIREYLESVKIPSNQVSLVDGSGLSRRNLVTPKAIAQFLHTLTSDLNFRSSLPIAGVDGTLTNRFKNTFAQGKIQAKTGTLTGAIALSGYANPQNYHEVIFSIIINNSTYSSRELQQYTDAIALLLTHLESCSIKQH